jgi:phage shock protein PspC (stress-responsive transcriptional regulator)
MEAQVAPGPKLVRPREGRWIAGVCAGIADRFGMSRKTVRVLFVVSTILPGPQFVVYLALWALVPGDE